MCTPQIMMASHMCASHSPTYLVVGLGNPGMPRTRHNVGMMVVDFMARERQCEWSKSAKAGGWIAMTRFPELLFDMVLLKPTVMMNNSGEAVQKAARHFNVNPGNIYLVHDDLERAFGKLSIKEEGSASGHNGVRSAITHLRSNHMKRLRIGIGHPDDHPSFNGTVADFVLSAFTVEEMAAVDRLLPDASSLLLQHMGRRCHSST